MSANTPVHAVPTGQMWGHRPTWYAKVGTMPGSTVVIRHPVVFYVGKRVEFVEIHDILGTSKRMTPRWRDGQIYKIEDSRLFIDLL